MCSDKGNVKTRAFAMRECGCHECEPNSFSRRFVSPQEEKEILENYQDQLQKELAGVKAHIDKLEKK
jgi:hypothetical protein